jgi:hypothetical protein
MLSNSALRLVSLLRVARRFQRRDIHRDIITDQTPQFDTAPRPNVNWFLVERRVHVNGALMCVKPSFLFHNHWTLYSNDVFEKTLWIELRGFNRYIKNLKGASNGSFLIRSFGRSTAVVIQSWILAHGNFEYFWGHVTKSHEKRGRWVLVTQPGLQMHHQSFSMRIFLSRNEELVERLDDICHMIEFSMDPGEGTHDRILETISRGIVSNIVAP